MNVEPQRGEKKGKINKEKKRTFSLPTEDVPEETKTLLE